MTVKELIAQILTQIGFAQDAGSISDADCERCRDLINISVLNFNKDDFLHFTKDYLTLTAENSDTILVPNPPLKIDRLTFRKGSKIYGVRQVEMSAFINYLDGTTDFGPRVFVYDRVYMYGAMIGRIRMDRASSLTFTAAVTNDVTPYEYNTDVLCIPPDYCSLIRADVQYRLLANSDASVTLKASKEYERNSICEGIKRNNFSGIDSCSSLQYVDRHDTIRTGRGRL